MAIYKNSTFGTMRKSIGDDVAYRSGGQNIVRKKPAYVNDARTVAQLAQRSIFAVIVALYRSLAVIVKTTFGERLALHSAYNVFMSINLRNAISIIAGVPTISYPNLQLSKGTLPVVNGIQFVDNADNTVSITHTSQVDGNLLNATDKIKYVAFSREQPNVSFVVENDADIANAIVLDVSAMAVGSKVDFYALHTTSNYSKSSDSVHLGTIQIQ